MSMFTLETHGAVCFVFLLLPGLDFGYVSIVKLMRYHLEIL
jgi:hypothetical protein